MHDPSSSRRLNQIITSPASDSTNPFVQEPTEDDDTEYQTVSEPEEEEEDRDYYDDFTTLDWIRDRMRDYRRPSHLTTSSWTTVLTSAVLIGFAASCIDIATAWTTDLRTGFCSTDWYLSRSICCTALDDTCPDWWDWSFVLVLFLD
jgi:chloride channel 3/4/5